MTMRMQESQVTVATSPARLAEVMNTLHAGVLANPVQELVLNEVLGRADCDVLTLEGGVYVPDADPACRLEVAAGDGPVLLDAVEVLHDTAAAGLAALPEPRGVGQTAAGGEAVRCAFRDGCAAAAALLSDLAPLAAAAVWGALVEVTVADAGVCWYREQAASVGTVEEALEAALRQRIAEPFVEEALAAVERVLPIRRGTELSCSETVAIGDGRDRVTAVRARVVRIDEETAELLSEEGLDDMTRRELFDSASCGPVVRWEACRLLA